MDMQHLRKLGIAPVCRPCAVFAFATQGAAVVAPAAKSPVVKPKAVQKVVAAAAPAPAAPAAPAAAAPVSAGEKAQQYKDVTSAKKTEHTFLNDTWLFELDSCKVLEVLRPAPGKASIVLSRTVFHPQGGGQPADIGIISAQGLPDLKVNMVTLRKDDGAVLHDCEVGDADADKWGSAVGNDARCSIDEARRRINSRVHSAGHLLDAAVQAVDLKWIPGKGYHFPDGPYVEYVLDENSKKIDPKKAGEKEQVIKAIQDNIDRLVSGGGAVLVTYVDGMRRVKMVGEECPCGGTHVKDVSEIGKVEVKKLQNKQGNVRLSYTLPAAA